MGKTSKGKEKAAAKIAAAKRKIARKCKGKCAALLAALGLAFVLAGCSTSNSAQPAKSQTQNNTFDDCIIVVATKCSVSNRVVRADGTKDIPAVELFTMAQSQESSGTESFSPTATQTPTTDVKPDLDVHYNDAVGKGGDAISSIVQLLTPAAKAQLQKAIAEKQTGTLTLEKTDGGTVQEQCADGVCSPCEGGACSPSSAR